MSAVTQLSVGDVFGKWTVVSVHEVIVGGDGLSVRSCTCRCECGKEKPVRCGSLVRGRSRSCGCGKLYKSAIHGHARHGQKTREYQAWRSLLARTTNPKNKDWISYGGRGITVCDRWRVSFQCFLIDMGQMPTDKHQLDRIDNDSGYCPENCRWTTRMVQANNTRRNVSATFYGMTKTVTQWSRITQVPPGTIFSRLRQGWPEKPAFWANSGTRLIDAERR